MQKRRKSLGMKSLTTLLEVAWPALVGVLEDHSSKSSKTLARTRTSPGSCRLEPPS